MPTPNHKCLHNIFNVTRASATDLYVQVETLVSAFHTCIHVHMCAFAGNALTRECAWYEVTVTNVSRAKSWQGGGSSGGSTI